VFLGRLAEAKGGSSSSLSCSRHLFCVVMGVWLGREDAGPFKGWVAVEAGRARLFAGVWKKLATCVGLGGASCSVGGGESSTKDSQLESMCRLMFSSLTGLLQMGQSTSCCDDMGYRSEMATVFMMITYMT
jgi:hypothetical protein